MSVTNKLSLILQQLDADDVLSLNRTVGAIEHEGPVGGFSVGILLDTAEHQQTLPSTITVIRQFYFRNTHESAAITVEWTPNGGAKSDILVVRPGGVICFWETDVTAGGISALFYTSDTADATYEHFIGG